MRIQWVIAAALAAGVAGLTAAPAAGQDYQFVNIADSTGTMSVFSAPSINADGTAAFSASFAGGSGVFAVSGGATTPIATTTSGPFTLFGGSPSINAGGTVAFLATLDGGGSGIFTGSGGPTATIVNPDEPFSRLFSPSINAAGTVAFLANLDAGGNGVFTRSGGVTTPIAQTSGPFLTFGTQSSGSPTVSINADGTVAFRGVLDGFTVQDDGIFTGAGGATSTIVDTSGPFSNFGSSNSASSVSPAINAGGTVAFIATLDAGGIGIFTDTGGVMSTVADSSGPFSNFASGNPGVNAGGTVAFTADLDAGGSGVFTGNDPVADKVIRTGDVLFGSSVNSVAFRGDQGLNDVGEVAFRYTLANGVQGVAVAITSHRYTGPSGSFDDAANFAFGALPGDALATFITPENGVIVTGPAAAKTLRSLTIGTAGSGITELRLQPSGQLNINETLTVQTRGKLRIDGVASALGGVQNSGEIELVNDAQLNGGTLVNTGLLRGDGTVGNAVNNQGRIEAIGGGSNPVELRFTGAVTNAASTGLIVAQNAALRFDGGLKNEGAFGISFGANVFGDINNTGAIQISGGAQTTFHDDVIQNGTMQVAKAGSTTSVAVFFGTLSGAGGFTGGGDVFALGDLRPGNSPDVVTFDGNLFLGDMTNTQIELAGTALGSFDKMIVTGELGLAGQLSIVPIDGFMLDFNQQFLIAEAGTLSGMFSGLGEGARVGTFGNTDLFITYAAGDGNDVQLFSIPEPASLSLLAVGGLLMIKRRPHAKRRSAS